MSLRCYFVTGGVEAQALGRRPGFHFDHSVGLAYRELRNLNSDPLFQRWLSQGSHDAPKVNCFYVLEASWSGLQLPAEYEQHEVRARVTRHGETNVRVTITGTAPHIVIMLYDEIRCNGHKPAAVFANNYTILDGFAFCAPESGPTEVEAIAAKQAQLGLGPQPDPSGPQQ